MAAAVCTWRLYVEFFTYDQFLPAENIHEPRTRELSAKIRCSTIFYGRRGTAVTRRASNLRYGIAIQRKTNSLGGIGEYEPKSVSPTDAHDILDDDPPSISRTITDLIAAGVSGNIRDLRYHQSLAIGRSPSSHLYVKRTALLLYHARARQRWSLSLKIAAVQSSVDPREICASYFHDTVYSSHVREVWR